MDPATIVTLLEEGAILLPKFEALWVDARASFSSTDQATVDAALTKAKAQDAADTVAMDAQADADARG